MQTLTFRSMPTLKHLSCRCKGQCHNQCQCPCHCQGCCIGFDMWVACAFARLVVKFAIYPFVNLSTNPSTIYTSFTCERSGPWSLCPRKCPTPMPMPWLWLSVGIRLGMGIGIGIWVGHWPLHWHRNFSMHWQ